MSNATWIKGFLQNFDKKVQNTAIQLKLNKKGKKLKQLTNNMYFMAIYHQDSISSTKISFTSFPLLLSKFGMINNYVGDIIILSNTNTSTPRNISSQRIIKGKMILEFT